MGRVYLIVCFGFFSGKGGGGGGGGGCAYACYFRGGRGGISAKDLGRAVEDEKKRLKIRKRIMEKYQKNWK